MSVEHNDLVNSNGKGESTTVCGAAVFGRQYSSLVSLRKEQPHSLLTTRGNDGGQAMSEDKCR
jgi:hypothetical protein